ncbi:hypothetical protein HK100_002572 [Physocladia obscura]|uniref:OPT superfamily oligopeptide transporter n=1 Tax=Physocladia obscura TaxID=109957 RepID=A0AAD5TAR9_9FUNG|nr:hypothetical protein HK100_002572 [Physocladia obscura]
MPDESAGIAFGSNNVAFQPPIDETKFAEDSADKKGDVEGVDAEDIAALEAERLNHLEDQVDDFGVEMVTKIVSLDDDSSLPVFTFRYFLIATLLSAFSGTLGQIYYFKPQFPLITEKLEFCTYNPQFFGKFLEKVIPSGNFLNPSKFNKKEHALIVITANTAGSAALANELIASMYLFYNTVIPTWTGIFLVLSSQILGYGFAGFFRETLVYPRATYYPGTLAQVSVYENLHNGDGISKKMARYFFIVAGICFCYEWLPQYIAPSLIGFSVICLATQHLKSDVVAKVFGGASANEGLGLFSICFDWNNLTGYTPMLLPWSTILNMSLGILVCCIFQPYLWYSNTFDAQSYPWMAQGIYSPGGNSYNQTAVLNPDYTVNLTAVEVVGLPGLAASYALFLIGANMALTAGLVHIGLYFGPEIVAGLKNTFSKRGESTNNDPYFLIMAKYPEAPLWWYLTILVITFALGMFVTQYTHSGLEWYMFIVALILAFILVFISGFISSTTGWSISNGVSNLVQMLGGFLKPGNPVANMYFTLFGSNAVSQATNMLADLKMGQYMKIPPRATFFAQLYGTVLGAFFSYFITISIITNNADVLKTVLGDTQWNGAQAQSYNGNAVTWGGFAKQMYGPGGPYQWVLYSFILGFILPLPAYFAHKMFPKVGFNLLNFAVMPWFFGCLCTGINSSIFGTLIIGTFTQFYLRKYRPAFFNKYQYITSAALDAGNQWCALLVTLIVGGAIASPIPFPYWTLNPNIETGIWYWDGCYNLVNDAASNFTLGAGY